MSICKLGDTRITQNRPCLRIIIISVPLLVELFISAIDHTFSGFTGVITHAGCWENTRKACKSRAEGT